MIIVGGGSSTRFGSDELLVDVEGAPLITRTIDAITSSVDTCVVVCRDEIRDRVAEMRPGVILAPGGSTRTLSEMAGLAALGEEADLIGIHDAARPVVDEDLLDLLFATADEWGGAVPVLHPDGPVIDRRSHTAVSGVRRAQTPQVFRGSALMMAYVRAAQDGYEGHDTAEVVQRYSDMTIKAVTGRQENIKVTFPDDVPLVVESLRARSRI